MRDNKPDNFLGWIVAAGAAIFTLFCVWTPARAELAECSEIKLANADKIIVDTVRDSSQSTPIPKKALDLDRQHFQNALRAQHESVNSEYKSRIHRLLKMLGCDWTPVSSDFTEKRSRDLVDSGVLMEVWATVENQQALMSYKYEVIPVLVYEYYKETTQGVIASPVLTGSYSADYPRVKSPSEHYEEAKELQAFTWLSLGILYLHRAEGEHNKLNIKANYYYDAKNFFCKAKIILEKGSQTGPYGLDQTERKVLANYAGDKAQEVQDLAQSLPPEYRQDTGKCPSTL